MPGHFVALSALFGPSIELSRDGEQEKSRNGVRSRYAVRLVLAAGKTDMQIANSTAATKDEICNESERHLAVGELVALATEKQFKRQRTHFNTATFSFRQ